MDTNTHADTQKYGIHSGNERARERERERGKQSGTINSNGTFTDPNCRIKKNDNFIKRVVTMYKKNKQREYKNQQFTLWRRLKTSGSRVEGEWITFSCGPLHYEIFTFYLSLDHRKTFCVYIYIYIKSQKKNLLRWNTDLDHQDD